MISAESGQAHLQAVLEFDIILAASCGSAIELVHASKMCCTFLWRLEDRSLKDQYIKVNLSFFEAVLDYCGDEFVKRSSR